jgi:hypothetical protein
MNQKNSTTLKLAAGFFALLVVPALAQPPPAQLQVQQAAPVGSKLPRLQVSAEEFDFGRTPQGSTISHVFWLKNIGEDTLRITDIKPG